MLCMLFLIVVSMMVVLFEWFELLFLFLMCGLRWVMVVFIILVDCRMKGSCILLCLNSLLMMCIFLSRLLLMMLSVGCLEVRVLLRLFLSFLCLLLMMWWVSCFDNGSVVSFLVCLVCSDVELMFLKSLRNCCSGLYLSCLDDGLLLI